MEPSQDSEHASDISTQKCGNCNQEKPIDAFVSRTKTKRPTRWCIDCRISGCEGHKRWAAKKFQARGGIGSPQPVQRAKDNIGNAQPPSGPEQVQISIQSQVPYEVYPGPYSTILAPASGSYGRQCPPGGFPVVTPPINPPPMYPFMWGPSPMPMMEPVQWVPLTGFHPPFSVQQHGISNAETLAKEPSHNEPSHDQTSAQDKPNDGVPDGNEEVTSKSSQETASEASASTASSSSDGADSDEQSSDNEFDGDQREPSDSDEPQEEIDEHGAKDADCSWDNESFEDRYFICMACSTPRPNRLGDEGICVYCFEHPLLYCIKGRHEEDKISFIDSDGIQHMACNRCRAD